MTAIKVTALPGEYHAKFWHFIKKGKHGLRVNRWEPTRFTADWLFIESFRVSK